LNLLTLIGRICMHTGCIFCRQYLSPAEGLKSNYRDYIDL
jgi:hypothetical protein